jgi:hypothetical protein
MGGGAVLTRPSSAETFAAASKAWLKTTQTHPLLTDANKTFCTALYLNFNFKHYGETGELIAWPGWNRLIAEFGLSKETISESIRQVERFRLLEVDRGRYDRATHRRAGNLYRALPGPWVQDFQGQNFGPCQGEQSQNSSPDQGQKSRQDSYDSPSLIGESIDSVGPDSEMEEGLPRESKEEPKPEKIRFERYSDAVAESRKRRAAFKRPAALNGGGQ